MNIRNYIAAKYANTFKFLKKSEENEMARILKNSDGSGTLYVNGVAVKTYARARDARRGAARLGVVVA